MLALDSREYTLTPDNVVIADEDGVESIGGIMGGEHSGCDENTTDVLIESALWDPMNIAKHRPRRSASSPMRATASSAASIRNTWCRGWSARRELVLEFCGGTPAKADVVGYAGHTPKIVDLPGFRGQAADGPRGRRRTKAVDILKRLGFGVAGSGERSSRLRPLLAAGCRRQGRPRRRSHAHPRRRQHQAAAAASLGAVNGKILTTLQIRTRLAKRALAARGMLEAVTWSFIPAKHAELFGGGAAGAEARQPDRRRHVRHAALAAAGPADRGAAQCRQGLWRRRDLRGLRHL